MIPKGWQKKTLGEVSDLTMGFAFKSSDFVDSGIPLIRMGNLYQNELNLERNPAYLPERFLNEYQRFQIHPHDILISMTGTAGKQDYGYAVIVPPNSKPLLLNQRVTRVRAKELASQSYLLYAMRSTAFTTHIYSKPGGTKQANISIGDLAEIEIVLPPKEEQEKIAKILSAWDEAIEKLGNIVKLKEDQKKFLERSCFFDQAPVKTISVGDIFERITKKNSNLESDNVLTISAQYGLINQKEFFKKSVASKNTANYFLLKKGDFAYNKSYSSGYPLGVVKPLENYDCGIVSPLYICFCLKNNTSNRVNFYKHFFESGAFDQQIASIAQEGARNHGLLNVSVVDFFNLQIPSYSDIEIDRLSTFFDCVDKELQQYRKKLNTLQIQMQGLMQQLLTGKKRVRI